MIEKIVKGLIQWLYGLFLDMLTYCANSLLGVMSADLSFFEKSVPIVPKLYAVFVAVGWGLLIGNCAFQSMKAMFAGLGYETDAPAILLLRTFLYGFLLFFSKQICDIGLTLSKRVIDLLGIPSTIDLDLPTESFFSSGASWLLVIIIGLILGLQLFKLFFEIAERYVLVGILTLLFPMGLAMGASKSTKDICTGYIRMLASMIVLMITNVLFLKLILSALSTMPSGSLVLPWCLLVVGLARAARKADNLLFRIGLNPASTGDPLGNGRGMMIAAMTARSMIHSAAGNRYRGRGVGSGRGGASSGRNAARSGMGSNAKSTRAGEYRGQRSETGAQNTANKAPNSTYEPTSRNGGNSVPSGGTQNNISSLENTSRQKSANSVKVGGHRSSASSRFGGNSVTNVDASKVSSETKDFAATGTHVNTDRFGIQKNDTVSPLESGEKGSSGSHVKTSQIQKSGLSHTAGMSSMRATRFGANPPVARQVVQKEKPVAASGKSGNKAPSIRKSPPGASRHKRKPR